MDEKSAVNEILAAYEKLISAVGRAGALEKKLADGTISLKEAAELNSLRARAFGRALSGKVLDIALGEREGTCTALLREGCNYTDELAQAAQRAVLARQGLNLTPPTANFEEDRAHKIGHSLEDTTVPDETIERRARSATENMLNSQYDRNMKKGAATCASAGLKTYIVRDSGSGCCKWCDEVSGRFAYGTEPKDVYRRHDNCTCTVTYESGRGRQNVWSKQYWSAEQEREYLRLRDEMAPKRLNAKQAQALRERVGGLTFGGKSATIKSDMFHTKDDPMREVLGTAYENNQVELFSIIDELEAKGVEVLISDHNRSMGYQPGVSLSNPSPGQVKMDRDASISAWRHERRHALDDEESGWMGRLILTDPDKRFEWEKRAYAVEIELAKQINRPDMVERLEKLLEDERRKIYGE